MFDFHEKRKIRGIIYSRYFIGALFLLGFFISTAVYSRFQVERQMAEKLEEQQHALEALSVRAEVLKKDVEHLKNDRGIEEELRSRFDVVKDGEQVIIIVDEPTHKDDVQKAVSDTVPEKKSFWDVLKFW